MGSGACYHCGKPREAARAKSALCIGCDAALDVSPSAQARLTRAAAEVPELVALTRLFRGFLEADEVACCCLPGDPCAGCRVQAVLDRIDGKPLLTVKQATNGRHVAIVDLQGDEAPDG